MGDLIRPKFSVVVELFVIFNCIGAAMGYIVVCSTSLVAVLGGSRQVWVAVATALAAPLALLRRMDSLRITSLLGVVVLLAFTLVVFIAYFAPTDVISPCGLSHSSPNSTWCRGSIDAIGDPLPVISSFVIFTNAFVGQQSLLPILSEIDHPTPSRLLVIIGGSMALMVPLYLIFCTFGYLQFGSAVQSDILDSYPVNKLFDVLRVAMGLAVVTSFPLQAFATRKAVCSICRTLGDACFTRVESHKAEEKTSPPTEMPSNTCCKHLQSLFINDPLEIIAALTILGICFGVAMGTSDLGIVVSLTGATGAAGITFIFPGLFYVFLIKEEGWTLLRCSALALLLFGMIIIPLSLTLIIMGV